MAVTRAESTLGSVVRTTLGLILIAAGFGLTLATLLGFFGPMWWAFDVLSSFRFQYAVVLLLIGLIYGMAFGRVSSFIFIAAGLLNAALVLPLFIGSPAEATGPDDLKIVSFNVQASNQNREDVMNWIGNSGADVVFLLETSSDWDATLAEADMPYVVMDEIPEDRVYGITVLATEELETEVIRAGSTKEVVVRAQMSIGDEPVVVYAFHPRSPTSELDAKYRDEVMEEVAALVEAETIPAVVVGDLNATPWSYAFQKLANEGQLVDSLRGNGYQASWPASLWYGFKIPIDHMLHTAELTTVTRGLGPDLGSDHAPLTVTVAVAAG
jgi:endonuclease/exonuclease/phosphatase (EEP) superfamily protein YafD